MTLTDSQKKVIADLATGHSINSKLSIEDQIAAMREEIDLILATNTKITISEKYKAFSTLVETEKGKKKATKKATKSVS